ncbi:MAG: helix-turn-helix domain-containing protein [archaeon]
MEEELREFGLTENEIKIYLALLKLGTSSPAEIVQKTGFSRSYVYDALGRLMEKEIVSSVLKDEKKNFTATEPKRLEEMALERVAKIQNILPALEKIQKGSEEEIKVEVFKGKFIYKTLFRDILSSLKKGGEILIFGFDDTFLAKTDPFFKLYLDQYYAKAKKLKIIEKLIARKESFLLNYPKTTKTRFLPEEFVGNVAFEVYSNKVGLFLWGLPNYFILIENKTVADSYRKQFSILWDKAKEK